MNQKIVYQLDANNVFTGMAVADESPREAGVYLIPAGCVEMMPPQIPPGQVAVFHADTQSYQLVPAAAAPGEPNAAPLSLDQLRALKIAQINATTTSVAALLTAGYPDFETLAWPDQKAEALAWSADNSAKTPMLDAMAVARGIDRVLFLQNTLAKVQAFGLACSYLVGTRQKYVDQAIAATTEAELAAIEPVFSLPAAPQSPPPMQDMPAPPATDAPASNTTPADGAN